MHRILRTIALLVMILTGSLPGVQLAWAARPDGCCPAMADGAPCPCGMPSRAPGGNSNPCGAQGAPGFLLAAPLRDGRSLAQIAAQTRRAEPSPIPAAVRVLAENESGRGGAAPRSGPGPAPPDLDSTNQELLSIFRI